MGGVSGANDLDMENRDPNNINDHVKVAFEDILAEPDHIHSIDCIWKNAFRCFECSKSICYKLATLCCGLCIALYWGCDFACIAFHHIWCYTPCLREFAITLGCWQKVFGTIVSCCCSPICETWALCLSKVRISKG